MLVIIPVPMHIPIACISDESNQIYEQKKKCYFCSWHNYCVTSSCRLIMSLDVRVEVSLFPLLFFLNIYFNYRPGVDECGSG